MAYTHFTAQKPGGYTVMYFDRHYEAVPGSEGGEGLNVPVALGCNVVRIATTQSRNLVLPTTEEVRIIGGLPSPAEIVASRAAALAEASRHDTLDELVDSARATWRSLLKGEIVETLQTDFATETREVARDEIVTDSGIIIIDNGQRLQAALAKPPVEFVDYRAKPHEMDAIEYIARVPAEFLPPHPEDLLSRLYL
jgi:hypothetical protein